MSLCVGKYGTWTYVWESWMVEARLAPVMGLCLAFVKVLLRVALGDLSKVLEWELI